MLRAFVFASLSAGARLLEVQANRHWVFLLSLVASSLLGKGGNLSFLLSALGMAGILYVQPRTSWAIALGPWLFTLPLTIWNFGIFPLLAPLWNLTFGLLISWLVLPLAILDLLGKSLHLPTNPLARLAAFVMEKIVDTLAWTADLAGAAYWIRPFPWILLTVALLGATLLWKKQLRLQAVTLALVGFLLSRFFPAPSLLMLDVGQGDALLLRTESALALSDLGPPGTHGSTAPVARALESHGIGALDHVVLSHFDLDHRGGLSSLLVRHPVRGALWFREDDLFAKNSEQVLAEAESAQVRIRFLDGKAAPPGWQCWLPPFLKGNDSSPLCRVTLAEGSSVLLTGDMGKKTEEWFATMLAPFPAADFLKIAHHGSRYSSSEQFLRASGAATALISVGRFNRYGHPAREALERIESEGKRVYRTDESGTFYFPGFTDEIMRLVPESRTKPGKPSSASLL
jgi:competence protein ComEC